MCYLIHPEVHIHSFICKVIQKFSSRIQFLNFVLLLLLLLFINTQKKPRRHEEVSWQLNNTCVHSLIKSEEEADGFFINLISQ